MGNLVLLVIGSVFILILFGLLVLLAFLKLATPKESNIVFNSKINTIRHLAWSGGLKDEYGREYIVFKDYNARINDVGYYVQDEIYSLAIQIDTLEVYRLISVNPVKWVRAPAYDPKI